MTNRQTNSGAALAAVGIASVVYFALPRETRRRLMSAVVDLVVRPLSSSTGKTGQVVDLASKYPDAITIDPSGSYWVEDS